MTPLYFATTNAGKLKEAQQILKTEVIGTPLEIEEIQSLDPLMVATQKAQDYFSKLKQPLFVEDGSLFFSALNGLPGPYIRDFSYALGNQGLCNLLHNHQDKSARAQVIIVYIDKHQTKSFIGEIDGTITDTPQGDSNFGWDPIFIPHGFTQTFAQMDSDQKNQISMRRLALEKLKLWLIQSNRM